MDAPFVFKASDKRQEAVDTEDACTAASEEVRDAAEVCRVQHKKKKNNWTEAGHSAHSVNHISSLCIHPHLSFSMSSASFLRGFFSERTPAAEQTECLLG